MRFGLPSNDLNSAKEGNMSDLNLNDSDVQKLEWLAHQPNGIFQQRAQAILLARQGLSPAEITARVRLTPRQVSYWLGQYKRRGTDIFPGDTFDAALTEPDTQPVPIPRPEIPATDKPGIQPDEPMSEAGRKVLAHYLGKLLEQEEPVRKGEDNEAIHDMRVASRRLRSALDIFGDYYQKVTLKWYRKELRRIARALGEVRDLDVMRSKAKDHAETLREEERQGLQPLLDDWQVQLDEARTDLLHELDSRRYARFLNEFARFVLTPDQDAISLDDDDPSPHLVQHVAPHLIYERFTTVRAYERILNHPSLDTLHALRIDAKRLRYILEAFEEVLGSQAKAVIGALKALQDHLGDLQDARVASSIMYDFVQDAGEDEPMPVVLRYLAVREQEKQQLLAAVNETWAAFANSEVSRALALAVAKL
jgi:CHAD domain-containing protein